MTFRPYKLTLVTPPATEPFVLADVKLFLRIDGSAEDALLTSLIVAARQSAEHYLRRSLINQIWKLSYDDYLSEETALLRGPVQAIISVNRVERDGTATEFDSQNYFLRQTDDTLICDITPFAHRLEITYEAGYGEAASDVPAAVKQGMLSHIAALYEHRALGAPLPDTAQTLYAPYRVMGV